MNNIINKTRYLQHKKYRDLNFKSQFSDSVQKEILDFYYQLDFKLIEDFLKIEQKINNFNDEKQIYTINYLKDVYDANNNINDFYLNYWFLQNNKNFAYELIQKQKNNPNIYNEKYLNKTLESLVQKSNKLVIKKNNFNKSYSIKILIISLVTIFGLVSIILFILFFVL